MTHLLDTNPCVQVVRKRGNKPVKRRVTSRPAGDLVLCAVVVGELHYGAEKSNDPAERVKVDAFVAQFKSLDLDTPAARIYARIRADLEARGVRIEDNDLYIAAIALAHNLKVVTHNTAEFSRITGLDVVDSEIP